MPVNRYLSSSSNYVHPNESNLLNIHKAMEYDGLGRPVLRTLINTATVQITGPVSILSTVTVTSSPEDPVHVHLTEVGTFGTLTNFVPIQGTVTATQGTNPWVVTGTVAVSNPVTAVTATITGPVNVILTGTNTVSFPATGNDAFGRLRVSNPYTLFDARGRYYDHQEFSSSTSTGASVVYDSAASVFNLNVTSQSGSEVIRETKRIFPYQPGKSLLILTTFAMASTSTNVRQRVGFFTTGTGIYFEEQGANQYFVIRSISTGTFSEERADRSIWNGPDAGIAIIASATQISWIDVEWLGVGSVRCGFVINGQFKLMHTFHHANRTQSGVPLFTTTYMTTACLPVRYEITNTGVTNGSRTMKQICSSVISEGGYNGFSTPETAGTGITPFRLVTAGTYYPVISIRLKSTRLDSVVLPRQVDILSPTVNYYRWVLLLNPVLTGATWSGLSSTGSVEYDTGARVNAVTGGTELASGYISSRELSSLGDDVFAFQLGRTLAGVSDVITLALTATSNNADVLAQLGWEEIT